MTKSDDEIAVKRVREVAESGGTVLNLGDLAITRLPSELGQLENLRTLCLGLFEFIGRDNQKYRKPRGRWQVPRRLNSLSALELLTLHHLDITGFPGLVDQRLLERLCGPELETLFLSTDTERIKLPPMESLKQLYVDGTFKAISGIEGSASLQSVFLYSPELERLPALEQLKSLERLSCTSQLESLPGLERLRGLRFLNLEGCRQLRSLSEIEPLENLESLLLAGTTIRRLPRLASLSSLQWLDLKGCRELREIPALTNLTELKFLAVGGRVSVLPSLSSLTKLERLNLDACRELRTLPALTGLSELKSLAVGGRVSVLPSLSSLTKLEDLNIVACRELRTLPALTGLTELKSLAVGGRVSAIPSLKTLTRLKTLRLDSCKELTESPDLRSMTSLRSLRISRCPEGNLDFLPTQPGLRELTLDGCGAVKSIKPVLRHLSSLEKLSIFRCQFADFPAELAAEQAGQNSLDAVKSHLTSIDQQSASDDRECKVLILGNGRAGKTSLAKMLVGEPFDKGEETTHSIRLWTWHDDIALQGDDQERPVRVNLWDFGGQDLYHNTHRLFLSTKAVFIVVVSAFDDRDDSVSPEFTYVDEKRPLHYWLDQIYSIHTNPRVFVVRSKIDRDDACDVAEWQNSVPEKYRALPSLEISAVEDREQHTLALKQAIHVAIREELGSAEKRRIGRGRLKVKEALRSMQAKNKEALESGQRPPAAYLELPEFGALVEKHCAGTDDASDPTQLLRYLHNSGVVFHRYSDIGDFVIVDQRWAINGIYTVFDRRKCYNNLMASRGRVRPSQLKSWSWDTEGYSEEEQKLFLVFMRSCRIAYTQLNSSESVYGEEVLIVQHYLPSREVIEHNVSARVERFGEAPVLTATAEHGYLHKGLLGGFLYRLGQLLSRSALVWKGGACFASEDERACAVLDWNEISPGGFGGRITIEVFGEPESAARLAWVVQSWLIYQRAWIEGLEFKTTTETAAAWTQADTFRTDVPDPHQRIDKELSRIAPDRARSVGNRYGISRKQKTPSHPWIEQAPRVLYQALSKRFGQDNVLIDEGEHEYSGIRQFMEELVKSDLVFVFISEPYTQSDYCMYELTRLFRFGTDGEFRKSRVRLFKIEGTQLDVTELNRFWRDRAKEVAADLTDTLEDEGPLAVLRIPRIGPKIALCYELFECFASAEDRLAVLSALENTLYQAVEVPGNRELRSKSEFAELGRQTDVWIDEALDDADKAARKLH